MNDDLPARFLVCKLIGTEDPKHMSEAQLWKAHNSAAREFRSLFASIVDDPQKLRKIEKPKQSFIGLKTEIAHRLLNPCRLCEWRCRVDRTAGKWGVCGVRYASRVTACFPHFGEEAPLIGENQGGSGTIFFAGCVFRCVFCQNYDISTQPLAGEEVSPEQLANAMHNLRRRGCANINLVGGDPIPNTHNILDALNHLNTNVPIVWNSDMYSTVEGMMLLKEVVDLWLPDFKYGNDECARRLSRVKNYFDIVSRNHKHAYENGEVVVRHLVLPTHVACCTKPILEFTAKQMPGCLVNIMDQYYPAHLVEKYPDHFPEIARRVKTSEMREVFKFAEELGLSYREISL